MKISLVIPSFGMTRKLRECLQALNHQTVLPEEVIVVSPEYMQFSEFRFELKEVKTKDSSRISTALNLGINLASQEIICFTDPDTLPPSDWIEKIIKVYEANPELGGLGGRDQIYRNGELIPLNKVKEVGKLTWFGRIIGNHHESFGEVREVDFLKGCNMSFRKKLIESIDNELIGFYRWEQDLCFKVKLQGYGLLHNPEIWVAHMKGEEEFSLGRFFAFSHNTTYILLKYLGRRRKIIFLLYTFLVGQRENLGFLRSALLPISLRNFDLLITCLLGKIRGITTFFKNRQVL
ncbi:glycosyltransferase family 2 protein [candidate division WOR-3 bacterium]|nr:glycosyltransferase family 2 protein [candidate division WOR-3 bacterium]